MPPYYQDIYGQDFSPDQPYAGGAPNAPAQPPSGVHGQDFLSAFLPVLAEYLSGRQQMERGRANLATNIVAGASPYDMLYGSQNPSAPYSPQHEAFWARSFPGSPTAGRAPVARQAQRGEY